MIHDQVLYYQFDKENEYLHICWRSDRHVVRHFVHHISAANLVSLFIKSKYEAWIFKVFF